MAFSYIAKPTVNWGTNGSNYYTSLMTDLATITGWAIWDSSQISSTQPYFVMKVTTDEGAGNELYFKIGVYTTNTNLCQASTMDGWNATTHVPTGNLIGSEYIQQGNVALTAASNLSYRISGDQNAVVITQNGPNVFNDLPMYLGLMEKLYSTTIDPALRPVVLLGSYQGVEGTTTAGVVQYTNDNRLPFLQDASGAYNGRGLILHQYPSIISYRTDNLQAGPYYGDRTYFSARPLVYDNLFGPRGQLRHIEECAANNITGLNHLDTVTIKGQQFYFWSNTVADIGTAQYTTWNNRVDAVSTRQYYFIRMT